MNFRQIKKTVDHLQKTCTCLQCHKSYASEEISVIATAKHEGLFEVNCKKCGCSTLVTVIMSPLKVEKTVQRRHKGISQNDVLDIKNFLNNFDGDFKKILK